VLGVFGGGGFKGYIEGSKIKADTIESARFRIRTKQI